MLIKEISKFNPVDKTKKYDFINYIDTSSVMDGKLENVQLLYSNFPSRAKRKIEIKDILISSVRPNLLHNYFVNKKYENLIASTGFIHLRVTDKNYNPKYIYYFLTTDFNILKYTAIAESSQTTYPSFNKEVIENIQLPNHDKSFQDNIVDIMSFFITFH